METANEYRDICKNVFKNGKNTITKEEFTHKWIELINRLEKNKSTCAV